MFLSCDSSVPEDAFRCRVSYVEMWQSDEWPGSIANILSFLRSSSNYRSKLNDDNISDATVKR